METIIQNAKIKDVKLGLEHNILSLTINIMYDEDLKTGQSYGGAKLDEDVGYCQFYIKNLLSVFEAKYLYDLKEKFIRIKRNSVNGSILEIGHLIKEQWFNQHNVFDEFVYQSEDKTESTIIKDEEEKEYFCKEKVDIRFKSTEDILKEKKIVENIKTRFKNGDLYALGDFTPIEKTHIPLEQIVKYPRPKEDLKKPEDNNNKEKLGEENK